ncbi:hypothetical protein, partial [Desulfosarcina cetonica]|uniref:hypothetical protein n=1 Tax=Desulfosarcina cetonica TaxID=90730 RepID=UPI001C4840DF
MNEIIQEILKKYGKYPSDLFPHIEWLKKRLLDLDSEIDELHQDRNRLLTELSKARNIINRLRAGIECSG